MIRIKLSATLLVALLSTTPLLASSVINSEDQHQLPLSSLSSSSLRDEHPVHPSILAALDRYPDDPVAALLHLKPELVELMEEPRLIQVFGEGSRDGEWMTEGDKLRLRREGKGFMDLTDSQFLGESFMAGKANTPDINHQRYVRPIFDDLKESNMYEVLKTATSYFNRYYFAETGVESSRWLHDQIAEIIAEAPMSTYISLEFHTHRFPQSSIIARFEPPVRNASLPLTIIGAHQDSANYLFPLLPAPGADDDMSGSTSILEAFRALAGRGYIPEHGPVEFHWYAAEEAGLLGSQEIVAYKKGQDAKVGAMLEFDMTAFVARNSTPCIAFLDTDADDTLTKWMLKLVEEYNDIPGLVSTLNMSGAWSDYMSWTRAGYPAAFAAEGDPAVGKFPGNFEHYAHTVRDRMDIDDETGVFSLEHMKEFSKLAIAFAVEQAGWSPKHTRSDDNRKMAW